MSSSTFECRALRETDTSLLIADEVIQELTNFGYGTLALSGLTFFLSLIELVCV